VPEPWTSRIGSLAVTRVLLIRHGQSEWNADGRWQGQADPPLTDLGRHQAQHASRNLGAVDAIVASDLQRASETALILAEALGIGPIVLEPGLRERDAGEWSGLTRAEIERDWPGYLDPPPADRHASFGAAPAADAAGTTGERRRPPGWEPDEVLLQRVIEALGRVHDLAPDGEVIAATHGGVVYALEGRLGAPFERLANLGGRWIDVGPGGELRDLGERVVLVDPDELTVPAQI
jgi:broad specificity phosphatase PhoE